MFRTGVSVFLASAAVLFATGSSAQENSIATIHAWRDVPPTFSIPVVQDQHIALGYGSSLAINYLRIDTYDAHTPASAQACWTSYTNSYYSQCGPVVTGVGGGWDPLKPSTASWVNDTFPDYPYVYISNANSASIEGVYVSH